MRGIAIITARGGSKRIPKKNIRDFFGQPIIAYSIKAALKSYLFSEVMVSTDDEQIAKVARSYGAVVPFLRSASTSDDYATTSDVLLEVLEQYGIKGKTFEWLCCLYPTAPFITAKKLCLCYAEFKRKEAAALIPIVRFSYPPQRSFIKDATDYISYIGLENSKKRSQDLEPMYHDVGQFYFVRIADFLEKKTLVFPQTIGFEIAETEMQDIDTLSDWEIAELKYQLVQKG